MMRLYRCENGHEMEQDERQSLDPRRLVNVRCWMCGKKVNWTLVPQPEKPVGHASDEPVRGKRRVRVLEMLSDLRWHPGYELTSAEVGGSEGLRRLRELRDMGAPIEMKKAPNDRTTRLYRMTEPWPVPSVNE